MKEILVDENVFQITFYKAIFGKNWSDFVKLDRNTDGYMDTILFEHKLNIKSFGLSKALSQALIYLSRFNLEGIPVCSEIWLVSQEENLIYIYKSKNFSNIINDVETYASLKASSGIEGFFDDNSCITVSFDINDSNSCRTIYNKIIDVKENFKVDVTLHNVFGWSVFYYKNAVVYGQKPEKKCFFNELRKPIGTLKNYINSWNGVENDFALIMDMLNDPVAQRKLGAFYTPLLYVELGVELLRKAIKRIPEENDYVIIDRCAGSGNLESILTDEELSHVIVSTYELKEWVVLKDRIGHRVRYIIPPIKKELPDLNEDGFLSGADALSEDFNKKLLNVVETTKKKDLVNVILYENPPYGEVGGFNTFDETKGNKHDWKKSYLSNVMRNEVGGVVSNDMVNVFIWSGFKYFLKKPEDSYILYAPIKYWKSQHLINKEFIDGYLFNREHFHASPSVVSCILWSNVDKNLDQIELTAYDIKGNKIEKQNKIWVNRVYKLYSESYYDKRKFEDDTLDGIVVERTGLESFKKENQIAVKKVYNKNIVGYLVSSSFDFERPRLTCNLVGCGFYSGHGFFLRDDDFIFRLPIFVAGKYVDHVNDWNTLGLVMKSGDGSDSYWRDVPKLNKFLTKCLIWTSLSQYPHIRSFRGSDGRLYLNQLCFDKEDTVSSKKLKDMIVGGYVLDEDDNKIIESYRGILNYIKKNHSKFITYDETFNYGLYQIDEEFNYKVESGVDKYGKIKKEYFDGELNNMIINIKKLLKEYYLKYLVDTLFEYKFLVY